MVNHPRRALTPALRALLNTIADAGETGVMEVHICANGADDRDGLQRLYNRGWVERCDFKLPRTTIFGVRATEAGREVLRGRAADQRMAAEGA